MIITNFPKQVLLEDSIETKHISNDKLDANVIKLDSKNFSVLEDGSLSLNIKLVTSAPEDPDSNYIYLVSENNIINSLSDEDKQKIDKLIINQDGTKFLANDGTYKSLDTFIKIYYNFDSFSSNNLLDVFNEMIYPSMLYAEIINDVNYPYNTGQLTIMKISETSANVIFHGLDQNIYTATINNGQLSDWKSSADENLITINKTLNITEEYSDVGISDSILLNGSYLLQLNINNDSYTGFLNWNNKSNNNESSDEILLHYSGDNKHQIYLRTINTNNEYKLQISSYIDLNNVDCTFILKKII